MLTAQDLQDRLDYKVCLAYQEVQVSTSGSLSRKMLNQQMFGQMHGWIHFNNI